ncbi:MAG: ABC transporter permease [Pseudomonadota bacterium]
METAFSDALGLILSGDAALAEILGLSLGVSGLAVLISCLIGFPLGAALAVFRFPGRGALTALTSTFMGLPPVVVGLTAYLVFSASGPLGPLGLLYTPAAMVIAQTVLVTPIVAALTRQVIADLNAEYDEMLRAMRAGWRARIGTLLWDARHALLTAALAGFGRASAEVGAVMIVGGNINHVTRTMTTAIALETSRGALSLALALGIVLLSVTFAINAGLMALRVRAERVAHG